MSSDVARAELRACLTEALGSTGAPAGQAERVADAIWNLVEGMVDDRVRAHLEVDPHLFRDGSSY